MRKIERKKYTFLYGHIFDLIAVSALSGGTLVEKLHDAV